MQCSTVHEIYTQCSNVLCMHLAQAEGGGGNKTIAHLDVSDLRSLRSTQSPVHRFLSCSRASTFVFPLGTHPNEGNNNYYTRSSMSYVCKMRVESPDFPDTFAFWPETEAVMATGVHAQGASPVESTSSEACSEAGRSCSPRCAPPGCAPLQGSTTAPIQRQRWSGNNPPPPSPQALHLRPALILVESVAAQCFTVLDCDRPIIILADCWFPASLLSVSLQQSVSAFQPCSTSHDTLRHLE